MIFVTVGGQLPFDRLIQAVDAWAGERGRTDVTAQIGEAEFEPLHMEWRRFLTPELFRQRLVEADFVVGHAGMGTIITCLELGRPILVLPRRLALQEQRNDHQLATAARFRERGDVHVAMDERELVERLDSLDSLAAAPRIGECAPLELLDSIRNFALHGERPES